MLGLGIRLSIRRGGVTVVSGMERRPTSPPRLCQTSARRLHRCLYLRGPWLPGPGRPRRTLAGKWSPGPTQCPCVSRARSQAACSRPLPESPGEGETRLQLEKLSRCFYQGSPSLAPHFETSFPTQVKTADGLPLLAARLGMTTPSALRAGRGLLSFGEARSPPAHDCPCSAHSDRRAPASQSPIGLGHGPQRAHSPGRANSWVAACRRAEETVGLG